MWKYNHMDELYHYGRKGMKWGLNIFSDKRKGDDGKKRPKTKQEIDEDNKNARNLQNILNTSKTGVGAVQTNVNSRPIKQKYKKMDLSQMSNKELEEAINRERLERNYHEVFAEPSREARGREKVNNFMNNLGTVLTLASTALGIAVAIKSLKGDNDGYSFESAKDKTDKAKDVTNNTKHQMDNDWNYYNKNVKTNAQSKNSNYAKTSSFSFGNSDAFKARESKGKAAAEKVFMGEFDFSSTPSASSASYKKIENSTNRAIMLLGNKRDI